MSAYQTEVMTWRQSVDDSLRADNSWLALAGLYWLDRGENTFGADPSNQILVPSASAPPCIGSFLLEDGTVKLSVADGVAVQVDGETVQQARLAPDTSDSPSLITLGDLAFAVLDRGKTRGIRLWDNSRPERSTFPGRQWFPIQKDFRISGRYRRFEDEHRLRLQRRNGEDFEMQFDGVIHFAVGDGAYSLVANERANGALHIMFSDPTNGSQTYGAGRYLTLDPPVDGAVWVDFNRAINPPCAFTEYATCLLPPAQNRLNTPIAAGEKKPHW